MPAVPAARAARLLCRLPALQKLEWCRGLDVKPWTDAFRTAERSPTDRIPEDALYDNELQEEGSNFVTPHETPALPAALQDPELIETTWHPNGYMLLPDHTDANVSTRHPIFELVERGQAQWEALLARQSHTLEQAVKEYRRRYKRNPPYGFEKWWSFAVQHQVVLKDEYDQIDRDLQVFRAMSALSLLKALHLTLQQVSEGSEVEVGPHVGAPRQLYHLCQPRGTSRVPDHLFGPGSNARASHGPG
jgi:hypothetical protein